MLHGDRPRSYSRHLACCNGLHPVSALPGGHQAEPVRVELAHVTKEIAQAHFCKTIGPQVDCFRVKVPMPAPPWALAGCI
eukprot:2330144-Amphidinium_carterae.1